MNFLSINQQTHTANLDINFETHDLGVGPLAGTNYKYSIPPRISSVIKPNALRHVSNHFHRRLKYSHSEMEGCEIVSGAVTKSNMKGLVSLDFSSESGQVFVISWRGGNSAAFNQRASFQTLVPPLTFLHTLFKDEWKLFSHSSSPLAQRMHKLSALLIQVVVLNQIR